MYLEHKIFNRVYLWTVCTETKAVYIFIVWMAGVLPLILVKLKTDFTLSWGSKTEMHQ